jgi:hypothetical protein
MTVKRFNPQGGSREGAMYESSEGKYVRHADHTQRVSDLIGEADDLRRDCQRFDEKTAAQAVQLEELDWLRQHLAMQLVNLDSMNPVLDKEPNFKKLLEHIRKLLDGRPVVAPEDV